MPINITLTYYMAARDLTPQGEVDFFRSQILPIMGSSYKLRKKLQHCVV